MKYANRRLFIPTVIVPIFKVLLDYSAKAFLSDLDAEITFGWSIMEVIASFEW